MRNVSKRRVGGPTPESSAGLLGISREGSPRWRPRKSELALASLLAFIVVVMMVSRPSTQPPHDELIEKEELALGAIQSPSFPDVASASSTSSLKGAQEVTIENDYPVQDDEEATVSKGIDVVLEPEQEQELKEHRKELESKSRQVIEEVVSGQVDIKVGPFSTNVPALGNFLFKDGAQYEAAPDIYMPQPPLRDTDYHGMWYLQKLHDDFFARTTHKRFIPRLDQPITRKEFHEVFRLTSTPVVIPFEHMRNLGVLTRGWTIKELREKFPYEPKTGAKKLNYGAKSGLSDKPIDLGPALYELERNAKLVKGAKGTTLRNFPRNLMIKPKYLSLLDITLPPFLPKHRFQVPTLWMGTTEADTKLHHDCCDNFVFMIAGVKRWFIAPPPDASRLRPIVCSGKHQSLCWAALKYPNKKDLSPSEKAMRDSLQYIILDLQPGEMLYLPAGWYHHIENLEPTVMVNVWTRGCQNSAVALAHDPERTDRPDFHTCPKVLQQTDEFLNAML